MRLPLLLVSVLVMHPAVARGEDNAPPERLLWPDTVAPGAPVPPENFETEDARGVFNVYRPSYQLFPAPEGGETRPCVIVFPGGGYGMLVIEREGRHIARWLNRHGLTAVVVKYRVSKHPEDGYRHPVPLIDAQRAVRTVRHHAAEWAVDPDKIGVMGFSAGGHLAAAAATMAAERPAPAGDAIDEVSARPDFAILVYPLVSMRDGLGHPGSRRNLLGDAPGEEAVEATSLERRVTSDTPPTFLVHGADDAVVPAAHSVEFFTACVRHNVPAELHVFETGAHGFTLGEGGGPVAAWPDLLLQWFAIRGIVVAEPAAPARER